MKSDERDLAAALVSGEDLNEAASRLKILPDRLRQLVRIFRAAGTLTSTAADEKTKPAKEPKAPKQPSKQKSGKAHFPPENSVEHTEGSNFNSVGDENEPNVQRQPRPGVDS